MLLRTTLISLFYPYRKLKSFAIYCAIGGCAMTISACASWLPDAHRLDLQQGNTIKLEQLEAIEIGMTKSEVRQIMGSPMLSDPFHNQRWDYIYRFIPNKGFERKSLLTLYFENDELITIDDSQYVEP
ncbi:MAG: outer membrane protein assembly factor BamE [Gammaproteobacteria bacterium]|nr:outer membrane protein assembly factor BamE [Gammaproteobacteria bacterium]